jgi:hypothetical protein
MKYKIGDILVTKYGFIRDFKIVDITHDGYYEIYYLDNNDLSSRFLRISDLDNDKDFHLSDNFKKYKILSKIL